MITLFCLVFSIDIFYTGFQTIWPMASFCCTPDESQMTFGASVINSTMLQNIIHSDNFNITPAKGGAGIRFSYADSRAQKMLG